MGIKRVAVLESNGETAQEIAECLKREGFEVCGVTDDGEEGLRIISSEQADVAVVGLVLKGLDGFGVLERLKWLQEQSLNAFPQVSRQLF